MEEKEKDPLLEALSEEPNNIPISEEDLSAEGRLLSPEESDKLLKDLLGEGSPQDFSGFSSEEAPEERAEHADSPGKEGGSASQASESGEKTQLAEQELEPQAQGPEPGEQKSEPQEQEAAHHDEIPQEEGLDEELVSLRSLHEIALELASIRELEVLLERVLLSLMGRFLLKWDAIYIYRDGLFHKSASKGSLPEGLPEEFSRVEEFMEFAKNNLPETRVRLEELKTPSGKTVGALLLGPRVVGDVWKDGELSFLRAVSGFVAISLDNALLIDQLQRKINQLSVLYKVSDIVNSSDSLEELASLVMEALSSGFGLKEGAIYIKQGNSFWLFGSAGNQSFEGAYESPEMAKASLPNAIIVPLDVGGEAWGFILALKIEETDPHVYSILASQISPVVKLLILERSYRRRLIDPVKYFLRNLDETHAKLLDLSVPYTLSSIEVENFYSLSREEGDSIIEEVEKILDSFDSVFSYRVYPNRILALIPGEEAPSVREVLNRELEVLKNKLKEKSIAVEFTIMVFSYPGDFSEPWEGIRLLDLNW